MSRSMTPAAEAASLAQDVHGPAVLVEMIFDSGPVMCWSGVGSLLWGSITFDGVGDFGGISAIEESVETRATSVRLSLSGIDQAQITEAMTENYQGRRLNIYAAFFDAAWKLIADPVLVYPGRMDLVEIIDGENSAVVRVTAENRLAALYRPKVRRNTDADQQSSFPGDKFFDQVPALQDKKIPWGS